MKQNDVFDILSPHLNKIYYAIKTGWDEYLSDYQKNLHKHDTRTRTCIIRDHIVHQIRVSFDDHKEVNLIEKKNGLFLLQVKNLLVRFKKLDKNLCSSNIPTRQSVSFVNQQSLPEIPSAVHLNVGYVPNKHWTEPNGVYLTYPRNEKDINWALDLKDYASGNETIIEYPSIPFPEPQKVRRVRAKVADIKKTIIAENE